MRLVLGGDAMLGRMVDQWQVAVGASPLEAIAPMLREADLAAVNLECAITADPGWYAGPPKAFYLKARPAAARMLAEAGVDLVSLANNHALDAGITGLIDTLHWLDAHHIAHAGAGRNLAEAAAPALLDRGGMRVALLAYCDHQADFAAGPDRPGIRYLDLTALEEALHTVGEDVRRARTQADCVIVAWHWQPNWAPVVEAPYHRLAHGCLEAGATVVWGHSPHHFQGVEWSGPGAILYATGDLVDDYAVDPIFRNDRQLLFALTLGAEGVQRVEALPLAIAEGRVVPAGADGRAWIARSFARYCEEVGTRVHDEGVWLVAENSVTS